MQVLVPCLPVLLDPLEVLSRAVLCDRIQNELWGRIATASTNSIFLWGVDFVLVKLALLTLGVDCSAVSLSVLYIVSSTANFSINI